MKPSSPLSLLLFIHLISASPIPRLSLACQLLRSCEPAISDIPKPANPPITFSDPLFLPHQLSSGPEEEIPRLKEPVKEPLTPSKDSPSKILYPSASTNGESLPYSAAQDLSRNLIRFSSGEDRSSSLPTDLLEEGPRETYQALPSRWIKGENYQRGRLIRHGNCGAVKFSWNEEMKLFYPMTGPREYSELLVVSIVILFLMALMVWEAVGRMSSWRATPYGALERRGPIYLEDDAQAVNLKRPTTLRHMLLWEKRVPQEEYADDVDGLSQGRALCQEA